MINLETTVPPANKQNKNKIKTLAQAELSNFGMQNVERQANEEANANTGANSNAEFPGQSKAELTGAKDEILTAIKNLKSDFSTQLDGILHAIEEKKKELADCIEKKITQTEVRVSTVEDEHSELRELMQSLKETIKMLEDKVIDMQTRSWLNNLKLVGPDPCSFLEQWIPEALEVAPQRSPIVMERAHWVGPKREDGARRELYL
ncbi:hypothetical protein ATANTOWER_028205 [Ataeniobius toweri]|uniref:Uncharacterized protein n=1 Tax=Ataeniobius toweri TaxID=208326 RepID=A0ABU7C3U5_9TELE|nr:hypothetical protein [Ataeniobius toweri]